MTPFPPRHGTHPLEPEVVRCEIDQKGNQPVEEEHDQGERTGVSSASSQNGSAEKGVVRPGNKMLLSRVPHESDVFSEMVGVFVVGFGA